MSTDTDTDTAAAGLAVVPLVRDVPPRTLVTAGGTALDLVTAPGRAGPAPDTRADRLLGAGVVTFVTLLHAVGLFGFPALGDDEGTYAAQAAAARGGELAHYTYWYDHPPLGWLQLALLDWLPQDLLPGVQPVAASRVVLVAAAAVSAALTYALARRLRLAPALAALAVLIGFASPLALTLQRQVYLDNLAVPWLLASLFLVLDPRRRLWCHAAAGLCLAVAVGSKETTVLVLPVLVWTLYRRAYRPTRAYSITAFLGGVAVLAYYPLMALLRGELLPGAGHVSLWDALAFQLAQRPGSGAMWQAGSASHATVQSWLFYDPWVLGLGLAGMPLAIASRRSRPVGLALLAVVLVALKPGGYLPAMYVIAALPLLGLSAAAAVDVVTARLATLGARTGARTRLLAGLRGAPAAAAPVAAVLCAAALALAWLPGWARAAQRHDNDARVQAERWLAGHLPRGSVVLTDDVTWVALVEHDVVPRRGAVWFYKLDTDPAVRAEHRDGWRDLDYVVSTDVLRDAIGGDPALREGAAALEHSATVATFGSGGSRVEIRRVRPDLVGKP